MSRRTAARKRVAEIMEETLGRGHTTVHWVRAYTRVPPSPEDVVELRRLGRPAIAALTDYAMGGTPPQRRQAIQFLGLIGGGEIIPSLDLILRKSPWPADREAALRWLPDDRSGAVKSILIRAAKTDPEDGIRELARSRLAEYSAK
jgi:hypothetical protein